MLEELHVHLNAVPRYRLLVANPALPVRLVFLTRGKPTEPMLVEQALYRGSCDADVVEAFQVVANPACAEVIVLAEVEHLRDHRRRRSVG
jgi:hypothetical protein